MLKECWAIAQMAKCKIMPVGISGTEKIKPYGQKLPRLPKVTITYGDPIDLANYKDVPKPQRTQTILDDVMGKIFELRDAGAHKSKGALKDAGALSAEGALGDKCELKDEGVLKDEGSK